MVQKIARARELRGTAPEAERLLWERLRNRRLAGFKFRRQMPILTYFADFACVEAKLIVELDGGQHSDQTDYDARRTEEIERAGYRVLRFWNSSVFTDLDTVIETTLYELRLATGASSG